jgi:hypothetical protein
MTDAILIKSERVLVPVKVHELGSFYGFIDEDTGEAKIVLTLSAEDVEAFGNPDKITVTIVAGDTLNSV